MNETLVLGYDPGGKRHGVAALTVAVGADGKWTVVDVVASVEPTVGDAVRSVEEVAQGARIAGCGVDTLTEWNDGPSGWRPADLWLRASYPAMRSSVVAPNALYGAMAVSGAAFLLGLAQRLRDDGAGISEAHPKVCHFALQGARYVWAQDGVLGAWLETELGLEPGRRLDDLPEDTFVPVSGTTQAGELADVSRRAPRRGAAAG